MSPALLASIHDELDDVRRILHHCMGRVSAMTIMAAFPDANDETAGEIGQPHPAPEPPPPRPGWRPGERH